jgi:AraC-like DNA-binding protein
MDFLRVVYYNISRKITDAGGNTHMLHDIAPHTLDNGWQAKLPGYYFSALSVFYRILYELRQEDEKNSEDYNKIKPACDYIHSHYDDPELNVPALAGKCFMSDTYFRKLFLKVYGTTPLSYINYLRMEKAKVLLSEFNTTVDYVALKSGFSDVKYFSTVFKKFVGVPPSKYRG